MIVDKNMNMHWYIKHVIVISTFVDILFCVCFTLFSYVFHCVTVFSYVLLCFTLFFTLFLPCCLHCFEPKWLQAPGFILSMAKQTNKQIKQASTVNLANK